MASQEGQRRAQVVEDGADAEERLRRYPAEPPLRLARPRANALNPGFHGVTPWNRLPCMDLALTVDLTREPSR